MIDFEFAPSAGDGAPTRPVVTARPLSTPPATPPAFVNALNDKQREAVLITDGPLIVLAGAGSGKTKMLTSRISYLIESLRVPPYQVLAVTFTNKAAGEMRERVEKTLAAGDSGHLGAPEIGTFHSVCVRLLRREMRNTPFTQSFVIYDDSDQLSVVKNVVNKLQLDDKAFSPKSLQAAINRAKCDALDPADIVPEEHNIFEKIFKRVYTEYQKDMISNNALDFGEILVMTYRLLRDNLELRERYQRRWRFVHVDEYQDTNRAQYLMLSMLANPANGGHGNICVVGDEDQSIYKWRGADIKNILDFEAEYPGAKVVKLEQNYRSTQTIITAASEVIKNNTTRKDKRLWTENEVGNKIVRATVPDERAEAEFTIGEIKRLAANEQRTYAEFAIFYRTNAQSRQFEDILRREKIPYQVVGGLRFYDRKEIKDVLAYFKVILNPSDSVNMKRVINTPARGIGKTTIDKLDAVHASLQSTGAMTGTDYWSALERASTDPSVTSAATMRKLLAFKVLIQRLRDEQPRLKLTELYHLILDETGYVRELRQEGTEEALSRIENLEEFENVLQEFTGEGLAEFIEQSSLVSDTDSLDGIAQTVKMMTLHSSKGLEFPVVFVSGMEEGLFPSVKPWEQGEPEDIEEERRLCYVGMTRAREQLYLMSAVLRRFWGNVNYQEPSRFFLEIPGELMETKDFTQRSHPSREQRQADWESAPAPSYSQAAPMQGDLKGRTLHHPEYGRGRISAVEGAAEDRKITVEFQKSGTRKFLLRYVASFVEN